VLVPDNVNQILAERNPLERLDGMSDSAALLMTGPTHVLGLHHVSPIMMIGESAYYGGSGNASSGPGDSPGNEKEGRKCKFFFAKVCCVIVIVVVVAVVVVVVVIVFILVIPFSFLGPELPIQDPGRVGEFDLQQAALHEGHYEHLLLCVLLHSARDDGVESRASDPLLFQHSVLRSQGSHRKFAEAAEGEFIRFVVGLVVDVVVIVCVFFVIV
jgi:hypothetical protein